MSSGTRWGCGPSFLPEREEAEEVGTDSSYAATIPKPSSVLLGLQVTGSLQPFSRAQLQANNLVHSCVQLPRHSHQGPSLGSRLFCHGSHRALCGLDLAKDDLELLNPLPPPPLLVGMYHHTQCIWPWGSNLELWAC